MIPITRAEWGARPPAAPRQLIRDIHGLVVHYSAAASDIQHSHHDCAKRVKAIQNFHLDVRGWNDIAYSFLFCVHGYVFQGRGFGVRTAAQGTNPGNEHYHAACFLGADKVKRRDITPEAREAMHAIMIESRHRYPHALRLRPHSQFTGTECPGDELRALISTFRKQFGWKA